MIREIVSEVNCLLRDGYPYSALGMALTLPDICGNIAYPKMGTGERYRKWFDEFALPLGNWPTESDFITLNGAVCYKLRCAYLHKGNFDLGAADAVKDIKGLLNILISKPDNPVTGQHSRRLFPHQKLV